MALRMCLRLPSRCCHIRQSAAAPLQVLHLACAAILLAWKRVWFGPPNVERPPPYKIVLSAKNPACFQRGVYWKLGCSQLMFKETEAV